MQIAATLQLIGKMSPEALRKVSDENVLKFDASSIFGHSFENSDEHQPNTLSPTNESKIAEVMPRPSEATVENRDRLLSSAIQLAASADEKVPNSISSQITTLNESNTKIQHAVGNQLRSATISPSLNGADKHGQTLESSAAHEGLLHSRSSAPELTDPKFPPPVISSGRIEEARPPDRNINSESVKTLGERKLNTAHPAAAIDKISQASNSSDKQSDFASPQPSQAIASKNTPAADANSNLGQKLTQSDSIHRIEPNREHLQLAGIRPQQINADAQSRKFSNEPTISKESSSAHDAETGSLRTKSALTPHVVPQRNTDLQKNTPEIHKPIFVSEVEFALPESGSVFSKFDTALSTSQLKNPAPILTNSALPGAPNDPNAIIRHISASLPSTTDGSIEVKLWPEELGRVRLTMTANEAGMIVQVAAERSEVLELMRKHIGQFEQELLDQGFENLSFSFGREEPETPDSQHDWANVDLAEIGTQPVFLSPIIVEGRVDIRL